VSLFVCLFVPQISREQLNGLCQIHGEDVFGLIWTSLNVKVKGQGHQRGFPPHWQCIVMHCVCRTLQMTTCHPAADETIASQPGGDGVTGVHADGGLHAVYVW